MERHPKTISQSIPKHTLAYLFGNADNHRQTERAGMCSLIRMAFSVKLAAPLPLLPYAKRVKIKVLRRDSFPNSGIYISYNFLIRMLPMHANPCKTVYLFPYPQRICTCHANGKNCPNGFLRQNGKIIVQLTQPENTIFWQCRQSFLPGDAFCIWTRFVRKMTFQALVMLLP